MNTCHFRSVVPAVFVIACAATTQAEDPKMFVPYGIRLSLPSVGFQIGETLDATVTLTNVSDVPIIVSDSYRGESVLSLGFRIRNRKSGEEIVRWDRRDAARRYEAGTVRLRPGQSYAVVDPVFLDGLAPAGRNYLGPGDYELTAYYQNRLTTVAQYAVRTPTDFDAVVESAPVVFRVGPATADRREAMNRFVEAWAPTRPIADRIKAVSGALAVPDLPDDLRVRLLMHRAELSVLRGDRAEAIGYLESAAAIESAFKDTINLKLGELLLQEGDPRAAVTRLKASALRRAAWLIQVRPGLKAGKNDEPQQAPAARR